MAHRPRILAVTSAAFPATHKAQPSPLRRTSLIVLVAGTVLALAAALGPVWLTRVGVVLAVATGVVACVYAWREIRQNRREHALQMLEATRRHGRALTDERSHNASVVDVLANRAGAAQAEVERQRLTINGLQVQISTVRSTVSTLRGEISMLQGEVSTLRVDNAHLRSELADRGLTIGSLQETVRAREAELAELLKDAADAEVHGLPRRVFAEHEADTAWLEDDQRSGDRDHLTVVDLRTLETAMILPNYEGDRKFA
jgi:regulator of replication initiation timing